MMPDGGSEHFLDAAAAGFFRRQADQRFGWQADIKMLREEVDILAGIHVGPVNLFLPHRGIRQSDESNGLDNHGNYLLTMFSAVARLALINSSLEMDLFFISIPAIIAPHQTVPALWHTRPPPSRPVP